MRFFKPNENFWSWIAQFSTRRIVDLGCGDGDLVGEMADAGLMAVGVDPHCFDRRPDAPMTLATHIIPLPAQDLPEVWQSDAVILCCRPCHNGFLGRWQRSSLTLPPSSTSASSATSTPM